MWGLVNHLIYSVPSLLFFELIGKFTQKNQTQTTDSLTQAQRKHSQVMSIRCQNTHLGQSIQWKISLTYSFAYRQSNIPLSAWGDLQSVHDQHPSPSHQADFLGQRNMCSYGHMHTYIPCHSTLSLVFLGERELRDRKLVLAGAVGRPWDDFS